MMNLLLKELIKLYFACVAVFGVKATNQWLLKELVKHQPKPMSLSAWNRQLIGEKKYHEINKNWGFDTESGHRRAKAK